LCSCSIFTLCSNIQLLSDVAAAEPSSCNPSTAHDRAAKQETDAKPDEIYPVGRTFSSIQKPSLAPLPPGTSRPSSVGPPFGHQTCKRQRSSSASVSGFTSSFSPHSVSHSVRTKNRRQTEHSSSTSSGYLSSIECGRQVRRLSGSGADAHFGCDDDQQRVFEAYSPFFGCIVELYSADKDPYRGRILFRAASLANKCNCSHNRVAMYLKGQRSAETGVFQAMSFRKKPRSCSGFKQGGYFVSLYAAQQYLLRSEELVQRKTITTSAASAAAVTLSDRAREDETSAPSALSRWCVYTGLSATGRGHATRIFPVEPRLLPT
jgi:hypothetical protein